MRLSAGFFLPLAILSGFFPGGRFVCLLSLVVGELLDRAEFYQELNPVTPDLQIKKDFERQLTHA
jgi:hypothetical protein